MKIYLAGPDVFLPDPLKIAEEKKKFVLTMVLREYFP